MGMMGYGAMVGLADEWLKQSDEKRANEYQEIRDNRLAEISAKEAAIDREFRQSERIAGQEYQSSEADRQRGWQTGEREGTQNWKSGESLLGREHDEGMLTLGSDLDLSLRSTLQDDTQEHDVSMEESRQNFNRSERQAGEAHSVAEMLLQNDLDNQRMKLSYGEVLLDSTDPNNPKVIYQAKDRPGSGTGAWDNDKAGKFFSAEAKAYYGKLDESGLTNFGSDRQAKLAGRASALSMKIWEQNGGRVSPNEIFSKVFNHISDQKALLDPEAALEQLEQAQADAPDWLGRVSDEDAKNIAGLEQSYESQKQELEGGDSTAGILSGPGANPDPGVTPRISTQAEWQQLPSGTQFYWGNDTKTRTKQ